MATQMAVRLALLVFAATVLAGWVSNQDVQGVLVQALFRLIVFYGIGLGCGALAGWLVEEHAAIEFLRWRQSLDQSTSPSEPGA